MATVRVEVGTEPKELDLVIMIGGSFDLTVTVKSGGVAQALVGDLEADLVDQDGIVVASFDTSASDKPNGVIRMVLTTTQTLTLDPCKTYRYDLVRDNGTADTQYYLGGTTRQIQRKTAT